MRNLFLFSLFLLGLFSSCKEKAGGEKEKINVTDEQGRKQGLWRIYYETGEVSEEVNYKDGLRSGKETRYYPNGHMNLERHWKVSGTDTLLDGPFRLYYETGQLLQEMAYKDADPTGKRIIYHPNGKVAEEGSYKEGGYLAGVWKYYNEEGVMLKMIDYGDGGPLWYDEIVTGKISYYHNNGNLIKEETWEQGSLVESEIFDERLNDSLTAAQAAW